MPKILLTGSAGFVGYHLFKRFQQQGFDVLGVDSLNNYYDVNLKLGRLKDCGFDLEAIAYGRTVASPDGGRFLQLNLEERAGAAMLFHEEHFDLVCHLAAQPGVRYSIENPHAYIDSNIIGFLNVLEGCRHSKVKHLVFASSSSVYGLNAKIPFSVEDSVDHPVSLYAATKKSNELMAHCYSYLYDLPVTGLRFFTVYGPWGRPDMALFKFTRAILEGKPLPVFNHGELERDFTYVDDIVEGIWRVLMGLPPAGDPGWLEHPATATSLKPYRIYNIGNGQPVKLRDFIRAIEKATGKTAVIDSLPMQPGDVYRTWADTSALRRDYGFHPETSLETGVGNFVKWYRDYYRL